DRSHRGERLGGDRGLGRDRHDLGRGRRTDRTRPRLRHVAHAAADTPPPSRRGQAARDPGAVLVMKMWPFRHGGLKLLSLGLAVVLWMIVTGEETVERGLRVPLELLQFPPGLELEGESPTVVDVRVRGSSATLSRVGPGDIVAVLDLHTARPGRRLFQLTPEQVRAPFDVQVVQVSPASLAIGFENSQTASVPITPSYE